MNASKSSLPKTTLIIWLGLIVSFWAYSFWQDVSLRMMLNSAIGFASSHPLGPWLMLGLFLLRPLLLLPSTLMIAGLGFLYGAFWGFIYGTLATLLACTLAYALAAWMSRGGQVSMAAWEGRAWFRGMLEHPFTSIFIARLMFMPGDVVNYAAGFLRVNLPAFLLATAIGGAPGMVMVLLAGASLKQQGGDFLSTELRLRYDYLSIAIIIMVSSLALSWYLRRRYRHQVL